VIVIIILVIQSPALQSAAVFLSRKAEARPSIQEERAK
jgi:hypothetical protein